MDNNVQFDLFRWVFSLCYPWIQPMVPCSSPVKLESKRCCPLMQRNGRGTIPGCQKWERKGRFPGCSVYFLPKFHSLSLFLSLSLSLPLPSLLQFLFLASHRLAESQARVVRGGWCFIPVPTTLCCMGGWVGGEKEWGKEGEGRGGKEARLVGGGRFLKTVPGKHEKWLCCGLKTINPTCCCDTGI